MILISVKHKIEWIDRILIDSNKKQLEVQPASSSPNLIFISHSFGAHLVQSLLVERPDLLKNTRHIIHLMPFFRFDPPIMKKAMLATVAQYHKIAIPVVTTSVRFVSSTIPRKFIDLCMKKIAGVDCDKGRQIAMDIFMDPKMMRNHLVLGTQEVRGEIQIKLWHTFSCFLDIWVIPSLFLTYIFRASGTAQCECTYQ